MGLAAPGRQEWHGRRGFEIVKNDELQPGSGDKMMTL